ncbi:MAG TPA: L-threonylcarbamoyladenylate synthase [Candidatus Limnocylindrales bacterium]|nr:L-threonylcarbamoyladenylate synthase [Candidatus Limnocylindrales bacterium]
MTRRLPDGPESRAAAVEALRVGGIVALPTDTVYGLAAAKDVAGAIDRLFEVKGRSADRAVAVLVADLGQAADVGQLSTQARALAERFWPGGLTLVVAQRADRPPLPAALTGGRSTVGLRVPDHPAPRALAAALGPLPTSSANLSGEPELRDADAIEARLGSRLALILDGGPARGGPPSTVVDVTDENPRILREGAIPATAIESCLRDMGR